MKLEAIEGLTASLRVDNTDLVEYEDNADELYIPSIGRKYVETTSGAHFQVYVNFKRHILHSPDPRDSMEARVYLDGKRAIGKVLDINESALEDVLISGVSENVGGRYFLKDFTFSNLETDDGPAKDIKPENVAKLGEVMVECHWIRKSSVARPMGAGGADHFKSATEGSISEKCLKGRAISQSATLGTGRACGVQMTVQASSPYGPKPFATFIFKYRSRRDLQIEGVIERDPTPPPLEERDPATLTPEEARELVRRLQAERIKVKKEGVKAEKRTISQVIASDDEDDDDDDDIEVVESEASRRKRTRLSNDSGVEVVDLTDD